MTAFATSVDRLINQVGHWEQSRWRTRPGRAPGAGPSAAGGFAPPTRADLVYALVQRLADRGADAGGHPRRPVPRAADLVLPDQLRVMADDLIAAGPGDEVLERAADDVDRVRQAI
jgi:hypothetical protein